MSKSIILLMLVATLIAGCATRQTIVEPEIPADGVVETGNTIDVSEKNGENVLTTPGDLVYLKLFGQGGTLKQWFVTSPTSSNAISLKDSNITNLNETDTTSTSEWWIKILETGTTTLQFNYSQSPTDQDAEIFSVNLISQ